jgi:hypothetical protein
MGIFIANQASCKLIRITIVAFGFLSPVFLDGTSVNTSRQFSANLTPSNIKEIMAKLITVFGATGNQGGSVIQHILADPVLSKEFKIRGITRDPSKPVAQALAQRGVEVKSVRGIVFSRWRERERC